MRANLELTDGLIVAERLSVADGRREGARRRPRCGPTARAESGRTFADELRADERVELSDAALAEALDPMTYLGSAEAFVDRALERYREERET